MLNVSSIAAIVLNVSVPGVCIAVDQESDFDETAIRAIQEGAEMSQEFASAVAAFEASNDPVIKAAKWEDIVVAASDGLLSRAWPAPADGWKLVEFPTAGTIELRNVRDQSRRAAWFTKIVAQDEVDAVRLRGAGALLRTAASDGEQWGAKLLLDIAQRPNSNLKRLTFWSSQDFGEDANVISWPVDWNAWQQAYHGANALGKAIILRNVAMLAIRDREFSVAAAIHLSALSSGSRELKAIALAFGYPELGANVTVKWTEIADNGSDPQLQALAQEVQDKFSLAN